MADMAARIVAGVSILVAPGLFLVLLAIILAASGKSIGVRDMYVKLILKAFEWGRYKLGKIEELRGAHSADTEDEEEEESKEPNEEGLPLFDNAGGSNGLRPVVPAAESGSGGDQSDQTSANRRKPTVSESKADLLIENKRSLATMQSEFQLTDAMYFGKRGIEAIIEDEVTQRFSSSELPSWNLLTRTNKNYQFLSLRLTILWGLGFILRYIILLPWRIVIVTVGVFLLIITSAIVGYVKDVKLKNTLNRYFTVMCCRIIVRAFGAVIRFHHSDRKAKPGGICVANHTSPIDVVILQCDNAYAMIGQQHTGFLGVMQRALSRATDHIWFERSESRDRHAVAARLRQHVADVNKLPILIFPEGTCINNTSVMMFKKGSFEVGGTIYPVAIKYDPRFADAFWNSSRHSMVNHIFMIMTSWALVCDVWYLPPETQHPDESAIEFANRVKAFIANQGGLVDLDWDGGLKREKPSESLKKKQQAAYSRMLKSE